MMLQATYQKKMTDSSHCQDPGGSHSQANCMGREDHLKLWVLKIASVHIDSPSFGKWVTGRLSESQLMSQ